MSRYSYAGPFRNPANNYIEAVHQEFEEDYDDYLEENHAEIARMEMYEQFRNEY